eukprot:1605981-Pyramimonas_sp.AAC.1
MPLHFVSRGSKAVEYGPSDTYAVEPTIKTSLSGIYQCQAMAGRPRAEKQGQVSAHNTRPGDPRHSAPLFRTCGDAYCTRGGHARGRAFDTRKHGRGDALTPKLPTRRHQRPDGADAATPTAG